MGKILKNIKFIFMPNYWLMNNPYSKPWDIELNYLMEKYDPEILGYDGLPVGKTKAAISDCEIKLGQYHIWIANYPYAYATIKYNVIDVRPSRQTIWKLRRFLKRFQITDQSLRRASGESWNDLHINSPQVFNPKQK